MRVSSFLGRCDGQFGVDDSGELPDESAQLTSHGDDDFVVVEPAHRQLDVAVVKPVLGSPADGFDRLTFGRPVANSGRC